jgi:SAM-dependent methyltransferase
LDRRFFESLDRYYERTLDEHGPTARGVDWPSAESQELRFRQLLRVCEGHARFSINDYGCGYGALAEHLLDDGRDCDYRGYDVSERMVELARERNPRPGRFQFVADESELPESDFTVASGLFNLRLDVDDGAWTEYVLHTLGSLNRLSRLGFAFNMLTKYSDPERMRPDLYYGDPCLFFDHCKRNFSRNVALLHDYGLYEFTILVRPDEPT